MIEQIKKQLDTMTKAQLAEAARRLASYLDANPDAEADALLRTIIFRFCAM